MTKRQLTIATILIAGTLSFAAICSPVPAGARASLPERTGDNPLPPDTVKKDVKAQPELEDDDVIPDSLLHPRWKIQRTTPITQEDLNQNATDLRRPDNLKQDVVYNDTLNRYIIGSKISGTYITAPLLMTPEEYMKWSERQSFNQFFRSKNNEIVERKGKEKFDFTDMHFDLGPAEKIFGPGGVRIKTQGTAELKFGATLKNIDNPSLPIRNRKTTTMNFDEKININVNGKVGDKVNMNLNYNTDATFDFDTQNLKLKYEGKEDEIIKLVEAGNISFPSNSSLIRGASSLFGLRTDLQFGKLKLQTAFSQKKSSSKSVSTKGGVQLTPFEINVADYEENRHFFLSHYFRDKYDEAMKTLPNMTTGININRVEIWVTNKSGNATNTRNIVALTDLGESKKISNPMWTPAGTDNPSNASNSEYAAMTTSYAAARDIDQTATILDGIGIVGGSDYEKLESARLLNSSEYTLNSALGYVSLRTSLQTDQVLAVAYEYTYGGVTYQVGEFASDLPDITQALFVKSLKNTSNTPTQGNWDLMMKNVYYLASTVEKDKFRLDVKYQSDTAGVYLTYIPEQQVKETPIIRLLGADRLDNNMKTHPNGYFDYVEGYTVSNGRVFFPEAEPFGEYMQKYLTSKGVASAAKYVFQELYDSTKTVAKQIAEKNKYVLMGQFRGTSANVISLGAYNVPQGSVVVTAGGVTLTEGVDYSVDYSAGEVTILNQSIIDAGTSVNVSLESNTDYAQQRKTMFGLNWEYDFSRDFQMSGTFQHLSEQPLTTKVSMGAEPLNNTLWGVNLNWKKESQWLTNMLDKIPFLNVTQPSHISLNAEFAHLIAGKSRGVQDNASYIDDFENTTNAIDVSAPTSWIISSVPSMFPEQKDKTGLTSGFNRSLLAWYNIDPLFTRRSSSLTPSHIKSDLNQLSNHYVREIYASDIYPNREQSSYTGATSTLPILNLAYYPKERGPYNFNPDLNEQGHLKQPANTWGGMMRKLDTNDFEAANIEYIEFWMLDPFIYTREQGIADQYGGDFYINLGEVSEDILRDGKKFYESGMPVDGSENFSFTQWGKIPTQANVNYSFVTSSGARALQDVGYNGLTDNEERSFSSYQDFLTQIQGKVSQAVFDSIMNDPANDNYHYFRGSDFDQIQASILQRYKRINNPQGNSPDTDARTEGYDTSYKTTPDVEDINQDFTLNEYEKYYQYKVSIRPEDFKVGHNFIVDSRETAGKLRNGETYNVTWYQFRIPLDRYDQRIGSINDFTSIRFMRMFLTGFENPIVLRFATLDLVRGEWRIYEQQLTNSANSGYMSVSAVNIEENNDKQPVNYILPPGISRNPDPTQPQLVESNEQALDIIVNNLSTGESKAVYKNTMLDLRQYKRMQMFVHANALMENTTDLTDNQLAVFVRMGSDYKSNYYEYEIPLKLTPPDHYDKYSTADKRIVWPEENMLDIPLSIFTALKKQRNMAKATGAASYNTAFSIYDEDKPNNKVTIMGNPTLGEVKTIIIGVRNLSGTNKSGEVWVNELRLKEYNNNGGWAAQANLNMQLSDFGTVNVSGKYMTEGFGGLEEGISQRAKEDYKAYSITTSFELGKFFPEKAKVSAPIYYSRTQEEHRPKYNPLDTDMLLDDALDAVSEQHQKDSIESIAVTKILSTNFAISNLRVGIQTKGHPMPYDPANFSLSYSHSHRHTSGQTTVYENEDNWRGALNYNWSPVYKTWEPFKGIKSKSKWLDIIKRFGLNWLPQNVAFNTEILRNYYELQERDMEDLAGATLPLTFSQQFLWNREFSIRWDITKNLHLNFQSATHAEVEEPYTPVNKDLYPDQYQAWKDSVRTSLRHLGTPLDYNQHFNASYQLPLNLIPIFSWINADANYTANYNWVRGTSLEDGTSLGNSISNNRELNINTTFNMQRLYDLIPFLKKTNQRFSRSNVSYGDENTRKKKTQQRTTDKALPLNQRSFEREINIASDTAIIINHNKKTKRFTLTAKTPEGKTIHLKYRKIDDNNIKIFNKTDSAIRVKLTVTPKQPLDEKGWYKTAQCVARVLMMVRNINVSYRHQQAMALPGFMPMIGNAFGQHRGELLAPGLDFAFATAGESYIEKARNNNWLLINESVPTPAVISNSEDIQIRVTLEPIKDLKIDLNATRLQNKSKSIQYMYAGNPTTQTGNLTMTTIGLKGLFQSIGDAKNSYQSNTFLQFCNQIDRIQQQIENRYASTTYPQGTPHAGKQFDPQNGTVNKYSADVLIPAFINTYTSMSSKDNRIFPKLIQLLPNWTLRYSGLSRLAPFRDLFKSVNINHAYRSTYAIGSYTTNSSWIQAEGELGFITDPTTSNIIPSSMYNVPIVTLTEAFSPLLGIDVTLHNNLTCKAEYKTTRNVSLSTTSIQINEAHTSDYVLGLAYKINDFKFKRTPKKVKRNTNDSQQQQTSSQNAQRKQFNNDLNLRLDIAFRKQANITRDIASLQSTASSGNTSFRFSFFADYTISKLLTMSLFYDRQTNTPLLAANAYPTTTHDFGVSLKFSLTR